MSCSNIEFYLYNGELWYTKDDGSSMIVKESDTEIVAEMIKAISERYPIAYERLCEVYKQSSRHLRYYQYLIVRRFAKCNFGNLDAMSKDIDSKGEFRFERVQCPLRGECKEENIICNPKRDTKLSAQEIRIVSMLYNGLSRRDIAKELFISELTVNTHIQKARQKLGFKTERELIKYAVDNSFISE